ncbi:response regulator [uncultured Sphaerochaeta sp.]|uniref:response regulator n=1 Tax=uncultured Sphaerochaeta sp. TaxID=886478 RepID=UPI002A0A4777|nr:response regulator [uncultured Sphaerochaeta sp.]
MPYKILLVDDETPVREGIRDRTPWEAYGFSIVGEAGNGIEALEIIDELHPDVVITDIRMPYLDGMELIKQIRYSYPPITIIILSGYDEFTYAQQAIRYDVSEYVLKPVSVEDICKLLERTAKRLDEDIIRMQDQNRLKNAYQQALPLIKEKFLVSLLTSVHQVSDDSFIAKAKEYGYDLAGDEFVVATFETDHKMENDPLQAMAMLQIAEEVLHKDQGPNVFQFENQIIAIFTGNSFNQKHYDSNFMKKTFRQVEQLHAYLSKYFTFPIPIGLGTLGHTPSTIALSYRQALAALNYSSFYPDQNILYISDLEKPNAKLEKNNFETLCSNFIISVKMGSEEQMIENVDKLFGEQVALLSIERLQSYILGILSALNELVVEYSYSLSDFNDDQETRNFFSEIGTLTTLGKARRWFSRLAGNIQTTISGQRQNSHIQFVEQAKALINTHFQETGFGLDEVCDSIGISPSYFSTTFKRETGFSFVQYLTNTRLSRAKELLIKTEDKTYEIARAIGFTEPNYFSFCFKRYEGCSPSQYRQGHR